MLRRGFVALAATVLLAGCAGGPKAEPVTIDLELPEEGFEETIRQPVALGADVTLRVTSAKDDGIHVHGYELEFDVPAGETVERQFTANMGGTYDIESHQEGLIYMKLIVQ